MSGKRGVISEGENGIPILFATGNSLAEAWENSLLELYEHGSLAPTQYDKKGDPESRDATMTMVIEDPSSEPLIHRAFPGKLVDLNIYRLEVMEGIKDTWVRDLTNPRDDKWEYTYHERLFDYSVPLSLIQQGIAELPPVVKEEMNKKGIQSLLDKPWARVIQKPIRKWGFVGDDWKVVETKTEPTVVINQIQACVEKLIEVPYGRRIQAVTWKPWEDLTAYDPACLQSLWFRILKGKLSTNIRFRSRDAYKAALMNDFAFVHLHEEVARQVSEGRGELIVPGRIEDHSDSYHIYGSYFKEFENNFLPLINSRSFEKRTWTRAQAEGIFEEDTPTMLKEYAAKTEELRLEREKE